MKWYTFMESMRYRSEIEVNVAWLILYDTDRARRKLLGLEHCSNIIWC